MKKKKVNQERKYDIRILIKNKKTQQREYFVSISATQIKPHNEKRLRSRKEQNSN